MRESFRTDQGYLPGLVWVYDGKQIHLAALNEYDAERASLAERLATALNEGFHTDAVWTYFAQAGGQHYASMRSTPEPLLAPDLKSALDAALASLRTVR
jgi:hypothetical protein